MFSRLLALLIMVLFAPAIALGQKAGTTAAASITTTVWAPAFVSMEIRAPSSTKKFTKVPWHLGITALDTMKMVDGLKFKGEWYRSLSDWLIIAIDGVANQGIGVGKKNWLLCVNGFPAGIGAGSYTLGPGAKVVWTYEAGHPPQNCQ